MIHIDKELYLFSIVAFTPFISKKYVNIGLIVLMQLFVRNLLSCKYAPEHLNKKNLLPGIFRNCSTGTF